MLDNVFCGGVLNVLPAVYLNGINLDNTVKVSLVKLKHCIGAWGGNKLSDPHLMNVIR